MISNFHEASGPFENSPSSYNYTFDEPQPQPKNPATKKKKGRLFGLGKKRKSKENMKLQLPVSHHDDNSTMTGQSLTYSTSAASYQTTGESTNSSGGAFGEILKLLDEEDKREIKEKRKQMYNTPSDRSNYSTTSSLAYSEGGTTLNYSEDGDQSYLEGTKLLGILAEPPHPQPAGGARRETEEEKYVISPATTTAKTPVINNKSLSHRPQSHGRQPRDNSVVRRDTEDHVVEEDEDPVSSSSSSSSRWLCGMDFGDAGSVLRPFFCF